MPWTSALLTLDEFKEWVASRKEAGRSIDIEICELGRWYVQVLDPYGLYAAFGEESEDQIGGYFFVRNPHSTGWVWANDLPESKRKSMYERITRKREAAEAEKKRI